MMTPEQLKNSILQRAIEGKLVPQIESEGTGAELLEKIKKSPLPPFKKGGKGKRKAEVSCPLCKEGGPLAVGDFPFAIPETWAWCRLGEVCDYGVNQKKIAVENISDNKWTLDLEDIEKDTGKIILWHTKLSRKINGDRTLFQKNQILYSKLRPYLLKILIAPKDGVCSSEIVPFNVFYDIDIQYVLCYLKSSYVNAVVNQATYGIKMPRVNTETMKNLLIPLPPLAEQKRIVAKLEELLPLVEEYAQAYNKLQTLNTKFPGDLKKSLLQYAMEGKLVPCDLSKWKQVKLGDIGKWQSGKTPSRSHPEYYGGHIAWLKTGDLNDGYIENVSECITDVAVRESGIKINKSGSVLIAMYGATIGKLGILKIDSATNQACCACDIKQDIVDAKYLFYLLLSRREKFTKMAEGGAQPNISKEKIVNTVVLLPPLADQKRIVAKLEELLPLCEELKGGK